MVYTPILYFFLDCVNNQKNNPLVSPFSVRRKPTLPLSLHSLSRAFSPFARRHAFQVQFLPFAHLSAPQSAPFLFSITCRTQSPFANSLIALFPSVGSPTLSPKPALAHRALPARLYPAPRLPIIVKPSINFFLLHYIVDKNIGGGYNLFC